MASNMYVRYVDGEEKIQISFDYSHEGSVPRTFNALRPPNEEINQSLTRIAANISKKVIKKKKKKMEGGNEQESSIVLKVFQNEQEVPEKMVVKDALVQGNIVTINGSKLSVQLNAPVCLELSIPESILSGFPIYPKIDVEFTDLEVCDFIWEKIKYVENKVNGKKHKNDDSKPEITECIKVADSLSYTPKNEDIDFHLKLTCTPKTVERIGKPFSVESKYVVSAGPGLCPFEHRQLYTKTVTGKGEYVIMCIYIMLLFLTVVFSGYTSDIPSKVFIPCHTIVVGYYCIILAVSVSICLSVCLSYICPSVFSFPDDLSKCQ